MHCRYALGAIALFAGIAGLTAALAPQEKPKEAKPAAASKMDDEMMAKMMAMGAPGAEHKVLAAREGKWTYTMKWWMVPDAAPVESTGTSDAKMIFDGRYLTEEYKGESMGMPFNGHATSGFDNTKKKYVSTWIDNMSTAITTMEGSYDAATKTFAWKGEGPDPVAGKYMPMRMVDKMVDANKGTTEFYSTDAKSGKEFKSMEMTYTRAK